MIAALTAGALTLVAVVAVVAATLLAPDRPEEEVAGRFVTALLSGDGAGAYELTTPGYRTVVLASDLTALAGALHAVVGDSASVEVLGSERTPGAAEVESLVGYRGSTAVGRVEGVVTVVQLTADGPFLVRDVSYRFPEAAGGALAELDALTRQLNEAVAGRLSRATGPGTAPSPGP